MTERDGGHAFPHQFEDLTGNARWRQSEGMTLRDWFAGQALPEAMRQFAEMLPDASTPENMAHLSYRIADAMLAQRTKENG